MRKKNGAPVARLVPDHEKVCTGRELAAELAEAKLPKGESITWYHDLRTARKALRIPTDKRG